jgi:hypothetical protein
MALRPDLTIGLPLSGGTPPEFHGFTNVPIEKMCPLKYGLRLRLCQVVSLLAAARH